MIASTVGTNHPNDVGSELADLFGLATSKAAELRKVVARDGVVGYPPLDRLAGNAKVVGELLLSAVAGNGISNGNFFSCGTPIQIYGTTIVP